MFTNLVPRFTKYVQIETRSNPDSNTIPSTETQVAFAAELVKELKELGMEDVHFNEKTGSVLATLKSNTDKEVPVIGFLAHMDTAAFNAVGVKPQIVENYDGQSDIKLDEEGKYVLNTKDYPNLKNYKGQTLITTDGSTLLGADDKAGIAEIMTAMEYLIENPEIEHGTIKVAFTPDEEIGTGANHFDVEGFGADFAYTMDGGPLGELNYENFNAATASVKFLGTNVHPGSAKDIMVNAISLAMEFHSHLPADEVPEKTEVYEGFTMLDEIEGTVEETVSTYIVRDHDRAKFEAKKANIERIAKELNEKYGETRVVPTITDSYFNMIEILEDNMHVVDLAKKAMKNVGIECQVIPIRGGTDGARLSYMGLPTPNIFAGGENMHGRFEFVSVETMEKAVETIVEIVKLATDL